MNNINLIGRVVRDVEAKIVKNNLKIASYTLAVDNGEAETMFINCICFGKTADFAEKWLKKGVRFGVSGKLSIQNFTDKAGVKRTNTQIIVNTHSFADGKTKELKEEVTLKDMENMYVQIADTESDLLPFND